MYYHVNVLRKFHMSYHVRYNTRTKFRTEHDFGLHSDIFGSFLFRTHFPSHAVHALVALLNAKENVKAKSHEHSEPNNLCE